MRSDAAKMYDRSGKFARVIDVVAQVPEFPEVATAGDITDRLAGTAHGAFSFDDVKEALQAGVRMGLITEYEQTSRVIGTPCRYIYTVLRP